MTDNEPFYKVCTGKRATYGNFLAHEFETGVLVMQSPPGKPHRIGVFDGLAVRQHGVTFCLGAQR